MRTVNSRKTEEARADRGRNQFFKEESYLLREIRPATTAFYDLYQPQSERKRFSPVQK